MGNIQSVVELEKVHNKSITITNEMRDSIFSFIRMGHTITEVVSFISDTYCVSMNDMIEGKTIIGAIDCDNRPMKTFVELAHKQFSPGVFDLYFTIKDTIRNNSDVYLLGIMTMLAPKYNLNYIVTNNNVSLTIAEFIGQLYFEDKKGNE